MRECVPAKEAELAQQHQLYEPMLYYGSNPKIAIDYISDIHLLHHAKYFDGDIQKCIKVIAKSLYKSQNELVQTSRNTGIQLFLGDISTDVNVTINFYKQYRLHFIYQQYKKFRKQIWDKNRILSFRKEQIQYKKRYDILLRYIEKVKVDIETSKSSISQYINYGKVIAPKGSRAQIENYLNSNYYKKRNLPNFVTNKILEIANLYKKLSLLNKTLSRLEGILDTTCPDIPMCLSDFKYTHSLIGVIILGNHEYVGFSNVETALKFYKEKLEPLGYHILQNQVLELSNAIIYGGSGFAKYNTQFNANNLKNCDAMMGNRSYEIEQTTLFEKKYVKAKEYALKTGKCFICATHYPVKDCLDKFDREAIYFSGHTHQNERIRSSDKVVYADNQIGYHNKSNFNGMIQFKRATTDCVRNPYDDLPDGYYQTTQEDYMQFYEYIGEYVGEGKLIKKRCQNGKLYVIKSCNYYGFFILNKNGISIVNGGKTKKIALSQNIEWIYNNFNVVVQKYIKILEPLREMQVQISNELKKVGFRGTIHGLIIDIDFYNHIMVNPIDGSVAFYYSPLFGQVQQFESFYEQLKFMGCTSLLEKLKSDIKNNMPVVSAANELIKVKNCTVSNELLTVSRTDGAYGVSRAVSPLQRLFTGHVLRDFDLSLMDSEDPNPRKRLKSWFGRIYGDYTFKDYLVVEDNLGEFITLMSINGKKVTVSATKIKSSIQGKKACWITKDISDTIQIIERNNIYDQKTAKIWLEAILHENKVLEKH